MSEPELIPCPKEKCNGFLEITRSWASVKKQDHFSLSMECPRCHLRDFRTLPTPTQAMVPASGASGANPDRSFKFADSVQHPQYGVGIIIQSGPNFSKVVFRGEHGLEREVITSDLNPMPPQFGIVCPRCNETTGTLAQVGNERLCPRCVAEIDHGGDQMRDPNGFPRNFADPKNAPQHQALIDMRCELCQERKTKLTFLDDLWICQECKGLVDEGDKVVRGSE